MYLNLSTGNTPGLRTLYYLEVKDIEVVITWILQLIKNEMQVSTQPKMNSEFICTLKKTLLVISVVLSVVFPNWYELS